MSCPKNQLKVAAAEPKPPNVVRPAPAAAVKPAAVNFLAAAVKLQAPAVNPLPAPAATVKPQAPLEKSPAAVPAKLPRAGAIKLPAKPLAAAMKLPAPYPEKPPAGPLNPLVASPANQAAAANPPIAAPTKSYADAVKALSPAAKQPPAANLPTFSPTRQPLPSAAPASNLPVPPAKLPVASVKSPASPTKLLVKSPAGAAKPLVAPLRLPLDAVKLPPGALPGVLPAKLPAAGEAQKPAAALPKASPAVKLPIGVVNQQPGAVKPPADAVKLPQMLKLPAPIPAKPSPVKAPAANEAKKPPTKPPALPKPALKAPVGAVRLPAAIPVKQSPVKAPAVKAPAADPPALPNPSPAVKAPLGAFRLPAAPIPAKPSPVKAPAVKAPAANEVPPALPKLSPTQVVAKPNDDAKLKVEHDAHPKPKVASTKQKPDGISASTPLPILFSPLCLKYHISASSRDSIIAKVLSNSTLTFEQLAECVKLNNPPLSLPQYFDFFQEFEALYEAVHPGRAYPPPQLISKSELEVGRQLGRGSYGSVYFGMFQGSPVALKQMLLLQPSASSDFFSELQSMAQLRSPHLVRLIGACLDPQIVVMEYMSGGDLFGLLHHPLGWPPALQQLPWATKWHILMGIARGIEVLHHHSMVHRDLKPGNILLSDELKHVKLGDFGFSRKLGSMGILESACVRGSTSYMSPELWFRMNAPTSSPLSGRPCDIYAFGIILWEVAFRRIPYSDLPPTTQLHEKVANDRLRPTIVGQEGLTNHFIGLIVSCWDHDPSKRPTIDQILIDLLACKPDSSTSAASRSAPSTQPTPTLSNLYDGESYRFNFK